MTAPCGLRAAALLAACIAGPSCAQQTEYDLGFASALLVRGIALGGARPALQGSVSFYGTDGWLAGLGVAALRPSAEDGWDLQLHAKLGRAFRIDEDWSAQLVGTHYAYPFNAYLRPYERDEVGATLAWRDRAFASVTALRQVHASSSGQRGSWATDLVLRQPLGRVAEQPVALSAGLGHQDLQQRAGFSYDYGHLGLSGRIGRVQLDLVRVATDHRARGQLGAAADARWVASLNAAF